MLESVVRGSKSFGMSDGDGDEDGDGQVFTVYVECDFLRRVRVRRRCRGGVMVIGVGVEVGDRSGGPRSFFLKNSLGGGSVAMLANGGQAASSILSGSKLEFWAAPDVSAAA